jgi:ankyrin repeat protein
VTLELIRKTNRHGQTALHVAAGKGHLDCCKSVLKSAATFCGVAKAALHTLSVG